MNAKDLIINIKTLFNGKGTEDAQRQLEAVGTKSADVARASEQATNKSGSGWQRLRKNVSSATESVSAIKNLFVGFGAIGAIGAVVGQFKAIKDEIDAAKKAQEDLKTGLEDIRKAAAVGFSAKLIDDLTASLKRANEEIERMRSRAEFEKTAARAAEDAQAEAAQAAELSAVSPDDPLAATKKGEIAAKYTAAAGVRNARRKLDDVAAASRLNDEQRAALLSEADMMDSAAGFKDKDTASLRRDAALAKADGDALVPPKWWEVWKTSAPDPKAQLEAAQAAAAITEKAESSARDAEKLREGSKSKRSDADLLLDRAEAYGTERGAAYTQLRTAELSGRVGRREAAAATEAARLDYVGPGGGLRAGIYGRLDSGISALENSPTAQASPVARGLLASAQKFKAKVEGMDMEALLRSVNEINAALDRFDRMLLDAKRAAARSAGRAARQRDTD